MKREIDENSEMQDENPQSTRARKSARALAHRDSKVCLKMKTRSRSRKMKIQNYLKISAENNLCEREVSIFFALEATTMQAVQLARFEVRNICDAGVFLRSSLISGMDRQLERKRLHK